MLNDELRQAYLILAVCLVTLGCSKEERRPKNAREQTDGQNQAVQRDESSPAKTITPEGSWIKLPTDKWPQIVLTNDASFRGHSPLHGASSFLIRNANDVVLAATALHLIGSAGGVNPELAAGDIDASLDMWKMHPRTEAGKSLEIDSTALLYQDRVDFDWLILRPSTASDLPSYPLKVRKEPVQIGEAIYLIGCPYSESDCKQNVYTGKVTERRYDRFRYSIDPPVDLSGFSGAPIIDENGHVVGVMTVWFHAQMQGQFYLEGGGEDAASLFPELDQVD